MPSKKSTKTSAKKVAKKVNKKTVKKQTAGSAKTVKSAAKKTSATKKQVTKKQVSKKVAKKSGGAKKQASKKVAKKSGGVKKQASNKTVVAKTTVATVTTPEKKTRSFKVKLPGSQVYSGRFTGLTPYQAANKALSKYFRDNKDITSQITFSIKESTRASKRSEYTYRGSRFKLDTPVSYTIKGGKTIVKEYKNKLNKVKKAELQALASN